MKDFSRIKPTIDCKCGKTFTAEINHPRDFVMNPNATGIGKNPGTTFGVTCSSCKNFIAVTEFLSNDQQKMLFTSFNNMLHL